MHQVYIVEPYYYRSSEVWLRHECSNSFCDILSQFHINNFGAFIHEKE